MIISGTVILTSFESASVYQDALRRVTYLDAETKKRFKFLTIWLILIQRRTCG
jgi:hypothetical protein